MLDFRTAHGLIHPRMPAVGSNSVQFAVASHPEGRDILMLAQDASGQRLFLLTWPLTWVTSVDDKVHADRPGDQAMREWTTTPPAKA